MKPNNILNRIIHFWKWLNLLFKIIFIMWSFFVFILVSFEDPAPPLYMQIISKIISWLMGVAVLIILPQALLKFISKMFFKLIKPSTKINYEVQETLPCNIDTKENQEKNVFLNSTTSADWHNKLLEHQNETSNSFVERTAVIQNDTFSNEPPLEKTICYTSKHFVPAAQFAVEHEKISISMLQRQFKLGFYQASSIIDDLSKAGVIDKENGVPFRKVLMTPNDLNYFLQTIELIKVPDEPKYSFEEQCHSDKPSRLSLYNHKFDYMEGHDFEKYCSILLEALEGYTNVHVTKGSNDNGIDILATKDGVKYGIQCKCYTSDIGVRAVQEAFAGAKYYDCHVPVVLTNRYFTRQAKELAQKTNVLLWDRDFLVSMVDKISPSTENDI